MQGNPFAAVPMSAGGAPVAGVAPPSRPPGVAPSLTQTPAPPPGTYPPSPNPFAPNVYQTPGPATLGSAPPMGGAPGGVAGVSMAQVPGVTPPAGNGGPHALPNLPQMPLPQGFPNPFQVQALQPGPASAPGAVPPLQPGTVTTTGPQGYMPGIGYVGSPGGQPGPAPQAPQAYQAPPPQPALQAPPQAAPPAQRPAEPHPFWQQLAWQLAHSPLVKQALGDPITALLDGPERLRVLAMAATCLTAEEMQAAFRALSNGALDQNRFIESFANNFKRALQSVGLLPVT